MHELSIAMNIVEIAEDEAKERGVEVSAVYLKLGPLSGVVKDALISAYEMAACGTSLEGSRLVVEEVPVVVFCPRCGENRSPRSLQWLCCPECDTPAPEVVQGSELQITALEVRDET
ncbi:MAG: hydrogenase maturation nickel metallochaperone HypA [Rhodospirillales bacterium]